MDYTALQFDQNFLANLLAIQGKQNAHLSSMNQESLA
jgi:hypothetical protein